MSAKYENNEENNPHGLKVGDIICAYHKGYHKITGFDWDDSQSDHGLVIYVTLANKTMKFGKATNCCDLAYCSPALKHIEDEIQRLNNIKNFLYP